MLGAPGALLGSEGAYRPALDMNFLSGSLDTRVSFSRASAAWYFNSAGVLVSAANNVPRFDYGPLGGAVPLGLLIEAYSATNLLLQSNGFGTSWTLIGGSSYSAVASGAATSPDGTSDGWSVTENGTSNGGHGVNQSVSKAASSLPYVLSVFAKTNQRTRIYLDMDDGSGNGAGATFDLAGGQVGVAAATFGTGWSGASASIQSVGNGWYRVALFATSNAAGAIVSNCIIDAGSGTGAANHSYSGTIGDGIYLFGADLKQQAFLDSYIPTTSAQATRAADVAQIPISAIPGFSTNNGMLAIKFIPPTALIAGGAGCRLLGNYGPSGGGGILAYNSTYPSAVFIYDGGSSPNTANNLAQGAVNRAVGLWTPSTESIVLNSGAIASGSRGSGGWATGSGNGFELGSDGSDPVGPMWFQRLRSYQAANPNLAQALAAGGF